MTKCKTDSKEDQRVRNFFSSERKKNQISSYFAYQACLIPTKHKTLSKMFMVLFVKNQIDYRSIEILAFVVF